MVVKFLFMIFLIELLEPKRKNMYYVNEKEYSCPVAITLDVLNDRSKPAIIWYLLEKPKRLKELHEDIPEITQKTLSLKLKELVQKGVVHREVFAQVPLKVVYSLTPIGEEFIDTFKNLYAWGEKYANTHGKMKKEKNYPLPPQLIK